MKKILILITLIFSSYLIFSATGGKKNFPLPSPFAFAEDEPVQIEDDSTKVKSLDYEVLKSIQKKKEELNRYETNLKKKEEELKSLKKEVEDRLTKFENIRGVLKKLIETKKDLDEKSIQHLVKVYETMKPNRAAPLIETLDRELVIAILTKMKGKNVGKILSLVDQNIAAKISEQIAKRRK